MLDDTVAPVMTYDVTLHSGGTNSLSLAGAYQYNDAVLPV